MDWDGLTIMAPPMTGGKPERPADLMRPAVPRGPRTRDFLSSRTTPRLKPLWRQ